MTPLLCAPPLILDQSFPRSAQELRLVSVALGVLQDRVKHGRACLVMTSVLADLALERADWASHQRRDLIGEIYRLLNQLFLRQHEWLLEVDLTGVSEYEQHPLPSGAKTGELIEFWSDEIGRLLVLHDRCCPADQFFIAVVCPYAFAGEERGCYVHGAARRAFPLVGPDDFDQLADAYEWVTPSDVHQWQVTFEDAKRNVFVLGASVVETSSGGGSHYKVRFPGERSWPLDGNVDPVPDDFLKELISISGYPLPVVRFALKRGELPKKRCRLEDVRVGRKHAP